MHNYMTQQGTFPPLVQNGSFNVWGNTFGTNGLYFDPWPLDWTASILGQIDQMPLYNQLNFYVSSGWAGFGSVGWDPQNTSVLWRCRSQVAALPVGGHDEDDDRPGDPEELRGQHRRPGQFLRLERHAGAAQGQPAVRLRGGLLEQNSGTTFGIEGVTDGSTNTAMFSETLLGSGPAGQLAVSRPPARAPINGSSRSPISGTRGPRAAFNALQLRTGPAWPCPGTWLSKGPPSIAGQRQHLAGRQRRFNSLMWELVQPLHAAQHPELRGRNNFYTTGYGEFMDALPPSCNHPGGINIGFADGSVRFIKNNIAYQVWWALGTRNGGESISSDAY